MTGRNRRGRAAFLGAWAAVLGGAFFLAATILAARLAAEQHRSPVTVAVDLLEVRRLARELGLEAGQLLSRLAEAGVNAVGVHEYTVADAVRDGRLFAAPAASLALLESPLYASLPDDIPPDSLIVGWKRGAIAPWLAEALEARLALLGRPLASPAPPSRYELWQLDGSLPLDLNLGFDPEELAHVAGAGLAVVARVAAGGRAEGYPLERRIAPLAGHSVAAVVFWGAQVSGYPHDVAGAARALASLGAPIGLVEFAPQAGFAALAEALGNRVVRVHSITEGEMAAPIAPEAAWARWARAVRERSVNLLYVRLYFDEAPDALGRNLAYVAGVVERVRGEGHPIGVSAPRSHSHHSLWTLAAAALVAGSGVGAAAGLLSRAVLRASGKAGALRFGDALWPAAAAGGFALLLGGGVLWLAGREILARQGAALATALAFPVLAVHWGWTVAGGGEAGGGAGALFGGAGGEDAPGRRPLGALAPGIVRTGAAFAVAVLVSLAGATLITAFLGDVRFLLGLQSFRGVKLAYVAPLGGVLLLLWPALRGIGFERRWTRWAALAVLVLLLAVYVLRSGNQGLPLWQLEDAVRRFLEERLVARPRTKELLGHPALIVAYALAGAAGAGAGATRAGRGESRTERTALRLRGLAAGLAVAGTVGQISILNTFAHAHTPVALSLLRTAYGALLGGALGLAAAVAAGWAVRWAGRARPGRGAGLGAGRGLDSGGAGRAALGSAGVSRR